MIQLTPEELLEGLSIEFVNRTCEVGVDINMCVAHNYMSNLVQVRLLFITKHS